MTTSLLKKSFHTDLCQSIVDDVQLRRANYYYFLGRISKWNESDGVPTSIIDSTESEIGSRSEIVSIKKIGPADISFVIRRIDWTYGVTYDQYDSSVSLDARDFYVMNSEFQVYKCLSNNYGSISSEKPSGTYGYLPYRTSDGYIWKYMYTCDTYKRNKFMSSTRIPVQRALTDSFYSSGAVTSVTVLNQGSGYVDTMLTTITLSGTATAYPVISQIDGRILDVVITSQGSGYVSSPTLTVNTSSVPTSYYPENSGGAILTPIISGGKLVDVLIVDPGKNYAFSDKYTIVSSAYPEPDVQGVFTPVIYGGAVVGVIIENPGKGYTDIQLTINGNNSGGTVAKLSAVLSVSDLESTQATVEQTAVPGAIYSLVLTGGGTNYTSATVDIIGDGTGATAAAFVENGSVIRLNMVTFGSGYTYANVVVSDPGVPNSTVATGRANLSPVGGHGKDAVTELNSSTICMYSNIRYVSDTQNSFGQDFRQYGIIKNLTDSVTGDTISVDYSVLGYTISSSNVGTLVKDEILTFGNMKFRVIETFVGSSQAIILGITNINSTFLNGVTLVAESDPSRTYITTAIVYPDNVNKYTGDMLFVSDSDAFTFNDEQEITIKTFLTL